MHGRQTESLRIVEIVTAVIGAALVTAVLLTRQSWLDRHFLPSFSIPRHWYLQIEACVRFMIGGVGLLLVATRRRLAQILTRRPAMIVSVVAAATAALGASEFVLRSAQLRPTEWLKPEEEPRREPDSRLGWVLSPARVGRKAVGGRTVEYAIDSSGYRVRSLDDPVQPQRDAIVFVGESVIFGEGLTWEESIPARTGALLGVQSADLAVHGYSTDQIYLRLERELPKFSRPRAVVSIFMTELFGRNLDDDRPHLDPGLVWRPAQPSPRLGALASLIVPYRRDTTVEQGVRMTREVLHATIRLAQSRGATPLIVVPQFGAEDDLQRTLRTRSIDEDIPYVMVPLDANWRLPWDHHPNAHAAHVIATAIAAALHQR